MTQSSPPSTRIPLWAKITLFASLAANLIVVGLVAGALIGGGGPGKHGGFADRAGRTPFPKALEPDQRREVAKEIRRNLQDMRDADGRGLREVRSALHSEALVLLRADPFDPAAFEGVMTQLAEVSTAFATVGAKALGGYVSGLDMQARHSYADRLESALQRTGKPQAED